MLVNVRGQREVRESLVLQGNTAANGSAQASAGRLDSCPPAQPLSGHHSTDHNNHLRDISAHVSGHRALCFRKEVLLAALHKLQQTGLGHIHQLDHFLVTTL